MCSGNNNANWVDEEVDWTSRVDGVMVTSLVDLLSPVEVVIDHHG